MNIHKTVSTLSSEINDLESRLKNKYIELSLIRDQCDHNIKMTEQNGYEDYYECTICGYNYWR